MKKFLPILCAILLVTGFTRLNAQGGNDCAAAMANPITLPFTGTGSTCNATNNFNNLAVSCIPSYYTSGPDWLYYFCATQTGQVTINLTNLNPTYPYSSISVYSGCPTAANCIAGGTQSVTGSQGLTFNVTNNQCYFIMIDNWPTPNCFTYNISISYVQPPPIQPSCTNIDFELGNFNGWYGTSGTISCGPVNAPYPNYNQQTIGLPSPQHMITSGAGTDPCGGFPLVAPGGNFSVRLGDGQTTGYGGGTIEQTFNVSAANANFTYQYAVVVQDAGAGHANWEQPFFKVEMWDCNNNVINCGNYLVVGGPNIPNFFNNGPCGALVYYRPWTTVNVDLSAYIGSCVRIKFTSGDCCYGGHYGYAYIDASCVPMQVSGNDSICVGQTTTLSAPPGSGSYSWNTGATTQNITVSPTTTTVYTVTMSSIANPNCLTVITDTVFVFPSPFPAFTPNLNQSCSGGTVNFTNNTTGATSYTWNFGDGSPLSNQQNPTHNYIPGNYTVTLTATNGQCTQTTTQVVNITGGAVTTIYYITSICTTNTTSMTNITSGGSMNWSWNFGEPSSGPNNVSNLQNPTHTYASAGTFTVTLISWGSNPACGDTIQLQVVVHPLPTPAFIATSVCVGQTTTFTDQSTISGGNITTWSWNFGDPNSGPNNLSNLQNPTHVFTAAGNYNVILTVTSNQGCQNTINLPVTVFPLPVAAFNATNVCQNNPMAFTDQSVGANAWSWNFGDNSPLNTSQNPSHTYAQPGNYTVVLTVTGQGNCTATSSMTVTVFPGPTSLFSATTVCVGQPTSFTDQSSISTGNITNWSWNFGDGSPVNTTQNPSHTYQNPGNYTVTLTVTSNNGCTHTSTVSVTVNPLPTPLFTNTSVCLNAPTAFTDQSTINPGTITSWGWNFGDPNSGPANTSTQQNPTHTFTAPGNYNVTLVVTSAAGCVNTISQQVVVNPLPQSLFTADDTDGCAPHCVNFSDLSTVSSGSVTGWFWDFGDGGTSTAQNPNHCYTNPGSYTVSLTVTTNSGCTHTLVIPSYIDVYPNPTALFSASPNPTSVVNTTVYFTDLSLGNPVTWLWDFGDGSPTDNTQHPSHTYPNDNTGVHTYTVTLTITNQYGCSSTYQLQVVINPEFTFFAPNCVTPNGDGINDFFFTYGIGWKEYKLMIFDRWGDLIWWTEDKNKGWDARVLNGRSGDKVQEDVYVWKVILTDVFDKRHTFIGHVSVIR